MAQQQQQQQVPPGAFSRIPGIGPLAGAKPRRVYETGPCTPATVVNLSQGSQVQAPLLKFQQLDIVRAYLVEIAVTSQISTGGSTPVPSPAAPGIFVQELNVQIESAYNTFRMPGWLAQVMQSYRSVYAPRTPTAMFSQGSNPYPPASFGGTAGTAKTWFPQQPLGTPNLVLNVANTAQTNNFFYEIPISSPVFDLYYEMQVNGVPLGNPIPRCIVSPQFMASTNRQVIPKLVFNQLLIGAGAASQLINPTAVATIATTDTTSTATGSAAVTFWREGYIPTNSQLTNPATRMWQYSRDYLVVGTGGAQQPIVDLLNSVPSQGQILSCIVAIWDPNLNTGAGGFTPYADYSTVEFLTGSNVQSYQDTPASNQYAWLMQHGTILPESMFGWDFALVEGEGKFTNERAVNTLVEAGVQIRINFVTGSVPSALAQVYVGLEMLKKVQ